MVRKNKQTDKLKETPEEALQWLQGHFFNEPGPCSAQSKTKVCGGALALPDREFQRYPNQCEYSCCKCGTRYNAKEFSIFKGSRLPLAKLKEFLVWYTRLNPLDCPKACDGASQCTIDPKAAAFVIQRLLAVEAEAARTNVYEDKLSGNLECDAHGLRSCIVSSNNPEFAADVAKAQQKRGGKKQHLWKLWLQILVQSRIEANRIESNSIEKNRIE